METEQQNEPCVSSEQTARLIGVLQSLEKQVTKQNSLKYALLKGMMYGFGTVVGASILVAILGTTIIEGINKFTNNATGDSSFEINLNQ